MLGANPPADTSRLCLHVTYLFPEVTFSLVPNSLRIKESNVSDIWELLSNQAPQTDIQKDEIKPPEIGHTHKGGREGY